MVDTTRTPPLVSWTRQLEDASALDAPVRFVQPLADALLADKTRAAVLQGRWLGHAVHPLLVMMPIGSWTSATVLDLVGGPGSHAAAQRLVATGLLAAGPAAITGWAEWGPAEQREKRVGVVHALSNVTAVAVFAASWRARRRDEHLRGAVLGLLGHAAVGVGGFLGGHLTEARKVGSRHPAFDDDTTQVTAAG
jgi:uncharacterized membrane protein